MTSSSPPSSTLPPSSQLTSSALPGAGSSNAPYVVGIIVFAVLIFGLIYLTREDPEPPQAAQQAAGTAVNPEARQQLAPPQFAPPPPEVEEEGEASQEATARGSAKPVASAAGTGLAAAGNPCTDCGSGVVSAALKAAVSRRAGLARGCYNRALRSGAAAGNLTVVVTVGSTGRVCGVRVTNDTVGSPEIAQCVQDKFRGVSFPKPEVGCVVLNVPISFKMTK